MNEKLKVGGVVIGVGVVLDDESCTVNKEFTVLLPQELCLQIMGILKEKYPTASSLINSDPSKPLGDQFPKDKHTVDRRTS